MRKEILFAIVAGSIFGLVIAFGIWRANFFFKSSKPQITNETLEPTESASPTPQPGLTLIKPSNEDVISQDTVKFSGVTQPSSWVVISGEQNDYIFQADNKGGFEQEIALNPGVNQILIAAFADGAVLYSSKMILVYSTEFPPSKPESTKSPQASSDGSIREKVQKKVEEVLSSPKAALGVVTDISGTTIQIKGVFSDIRQIAVSKDTVVVKGVQTVKLTDIAIGDFILGMGFKNGNGILDTKRILITTPIQDPNRKILAGKISDVTKKDITIFPSGGESPVAGTPVKGSDIKLSDFKVDQKIIAVILIGKNGIEFRALAPSEPRESPSPNASPSPKPTSL